MDRHIPMSLFKTVVLPNIMKIITTDNNGSLHLHLGYNSSKDTTTNGNVSCEWAFLVNVGTLDGLLKFDIEHKN